MNVSLEITTIVLILFSIILVFYHLKAGEHDDHKTVEIDVLYNRLGTCPCDATEHKLRPSNKLRALATGGVSTIVTAKYVIKHRYRTI
jgi:hypothetical protein